MRKITIGKNDAEQRLDRFLAKYLPHAPVSFLQKSIRTRHIKRNGKRTAPDVMLQEGDEIAFYVYEEVLAPFEAHRKERTSQLHLPIVYEDPSILVFDKPKGVLSHAASPRDYGQNAVDWVTEYLIQKGEYLPRRERSFRPAVVNRLDRQTEGLMIAAKTHESLQRYNRNMTEHRIHKVYYALVLGSLTRDLVLQAPLLREGRNTRVVHDEEPANAREALTIVHPKRTGRWTTLVEIELHTGRTHQIRAHLADAGWPLLGDRRYGLERAGRIQRGDFFRVHADRPSSQCLLAASLHFSEETADALAGRTLWSTFATRFLQEAEAWIRAEGRLA